ncbi:OmpH family outer membrane protein [Rhodohalobacter sp. SW132]|uniref:OmpH family outer membrane protein n=1 Tax=Rhodohalobacter sp. SW132 TaxID=2293433 RepID=UPI000E23F216|nr:OmpH family outer membrane protein [Rhodohalobacter sp. SW132]REL33362.1 OmpH family outer membrane protein [Rhodohalobacter sp. SW132]
MKKLQLLIIFLFIPLLASAQLSVGVMNPDQVLDSLPETSEIESTLQQFVQEREQRFQARYQEWIEELTAYTEQAEAGNFTEAQQQAEEERLSEMEEELSGLQNRIQNQIRQRQNELFSPLLNRVEAAMETVARDMGLEYVLNRQSGTGEPIVYYMSDRGVDITERVIEYLTQN